MYCKFNHRRTGLKIFGEGGEHEFSQLVPKAREPLGASGGMLRRKILKNRFLCFGVGFMHKTSDKWKENFKNISETKPEQEDCPTL